MKPSCEFCEHWDMDSPAPNMGVCRRLLGPENPRGNVVRNFDGTMLSSEDSWCDAYVSVEHEPA
jgi:hypothetical protein